MCNSSLQRHARSWNEQMVAARDLHDKFQEQGENAPLICKHCSELAVRDIYWPCKTIRVMEAVIAND